MADQIFTVNLPDIGEGVVEGEVIEWLKNVGDPIKQDEPVVIVMTDKATVELPAPFPGILAKQYYKPGEISIRDKPLYDIEVTEVSAIASKSESTQFESSIPDKPTKRGKPSTLRKETLVKSAMVLATPKVRHLAKELGIDLSSIQGSGKEGRILSQDLVQPIQKETERHPIDLEDFEEVPLKGIQGMMAKKMSQATEIPIFSYFEQVEATRLVQVRQNIKREAADEGIQLSYMPFFIRALSLCAKKYPLMLSSVDMTSKKLFIHKQHNIGIAMASKEGLIVPVLKNVQDISLEEIIRGYDELKRKAQSNKLDPNDMRGAAITISNFGALQGDGLWATPIINPPEVAIIAIGHMRPQAVVKNHEVVVKEMISFSWSFDHRVIDGAHAAAISHYFCSLIRDPALLL